MSSASIRRLILRSGLRIVLVILGGILLGGMLVRWAPGFGVDELDLNPRLSAESKEALRAARTKDSGLTHFWIRYCGSILRGDLGISTAFQRPVSDLIVERLEVTIPLLAFGAFAGMATGLAAAFLTAVTGSSAWEWFSTAASAALLSIPAALLGLFFFWMDSPPQWAVALMVAPHIYRYASEVLRASLKAPHLVLAQAMGLPQPQIWLSHIAWPLAPELLAICGSAVTLAFGACVPIEVICDLPGIGQLAWKSALSRDLPAVVSITVLVALLNSVVNSAADIAGALVRRRGCLT